MTAYRTAMGLELHGTTDEIIGDSDHPNGSGRHVYYLINDPETDAPRYLLTRYGHVEDAWAVELVTLPHVHPDALGPSQITERLSYSIDDPTAIAHGGDDLVAIDGVVYMTREPAWVVYVTGADLPEVA